ncbi:hypothetical protein BCR42DRAFT_416521 [Absidia repens]|uniref:Uncharacterized protein n=1 Tax=Absidia repens TaxID=90262 RepID=A0A1X2IEN8_9FUNG|nr:hypothetical protein BCR42DRAFT_416521 [Absidia repens]
MPLPKPIDHYFYSLLNRAPSDVAFESLPSLKAQPNTIKRFSDSIYHSYKSLGLSFSFVINNNNNSSNKSIKQCSDNDDALLLDAIDIYNGVTSDGFQPYSLDMALPCGLEGSMQAHDIVSLLGEPDRKGGGGQSRVACWIEYKFEQDGGGLMIQLHGIDWDDRTMGWTSIVLYR